MTATLIRFHDYRYLRRTSRLQRTQDDLAFALWRLGAAYAALGFVSMICLLQGKR